MKYIVETTEEGFIETLETGGKTLQKRWKGNGGSAQCRDMDFADQLESLGIIDEDILNRIYDTLDENYIGMDLKKIDRRLEARMRMVETP